MEIKLKAGYHDHKIEVTDTNVHIEYAASKSIYENIEGKIRRTGFDVTDEALDKISSLLEDLIYYRSADYDSSELIKRLFINLPDKITEETLEILNQKYGE